jgi:hypothetical protein
MMCKAVLTTESANSQSVANALDTDNVRMSALTIKTTASEHKVTTTIEAESVSTLMSTIDDVLRCQIASESMI